MSDLLSLFKRKAHASGAGPSAVGAPVPSRASVLKSPISNLKSRPSSLPSVKPFACLAHFAVKSLRALALGTAPLGTTSPLREVSVLICVHLWLIIARPDFLSPPKLCHALPRVLWNKKRLFIFPRPLSWTVPSSSIFYPRFKTVQATLLHFVLYCPIAHFWKKIFISNRHVTHAITFKNPRNPWFMSFP